MHKKLSCLLANAIIVTGAISAQNVSSPETVHRGAEVSAVTGQSWIKRLNKPFEETAMGRTGHVGPAPGQEDKTRLIQVPPAPTTPRLVSGEDLYRLNCRECHGESGQGAPPEINSVISPVRATSTPLVLQRMKSTGMKIAQADASSFQNRPAPHCCRGFIREARTCLHSPI